MDGRRISRLTTGHHLRHGVLGAFATGWRKLHILHSTITIGAPLRLTFLNAKSSLCNFWRSAEGCCPFPRINLNMTSVNHHGNLRQRHLKHVTSTSTLLNVMPTLINTQTTTRTQIYPTHICNTSNSTYIRHSRRRKRLTTSTYLHDPSHSVKTGCPRNEYISYIY